MVKPKVATEKHLSAEELLALSDRLFSPSLKPSRLITVPQPPTLAGSKLAPPWAEIDERPSWRARRFRLWRDNAPSLRLAVLDPKRRIHLRRYQPYALPPAAARTFGVRAIPVVLNPKPDPRKPPPSWPLILPRTPYAGNPTVKIPKWERKARYQRLLQYQWALDQEHQRRFRKGMAFMIKEVVRFEMMRYLKANSWDPELWHEADDGPIAEYLIRFFRDIRKKSGNIYHHLKLNDIPRLPASRRDEVHRAIRVEDKRKEKRDASKAAKKSAADNGGAAILQAQPGSTVDIPASIVPSQTPRPVKAKRNAVTSIPATAPLDITGDRAGELDELEALRAHKKAERRANRRKRRDGATPEPNRPCTVMSDRSVADRESIKERASKPKPKPPRLSVNAIDEPPGEMSTSPSSATSTSTIFTPSDSSRNAITSPKPRRGTDAISPGLCVVSSPTYRSTKVIQSMRYVGKVDKRTGVYHPHSQTQSQGTSDEREVRAALEQIGAEKCEDGGTSLTRNHESVGEQSARNWKVFIVRAPNGLDHSSLARLLPQSRSASNEVLQVSQTGKEDISSTKKANVRAEERKAGDVKEAPDPSRPKRAQTMTRHGRPRISGDSKGSHGKEVSRADAAVPLESKGEEHIRDLGQKLSALDLSSTPSRRLTITPSPTDPLTEDDSEYALSRSPSVLSIVYGDLNKDEDTAAPFASSARSARNDASLPGWTTSEASGSDTDDSMIDHLTIGHPGWTQASDVASEPDTLATARPDRYRRSLITS